MRVQPGTYRLIYKFLLRFLAIYFSLWLFPFPFTIFSFTEKLFTWYYKIWDILVPMTARSILGITGALEPGSDSTFALVQLFLFAIIAFLSAIVWTIADRDHKFDHLLYWIKVYIRYGLAFWILGYAMGKILKYQFPTPGPYYFARTYGETSPMELLWNFMGYSYSYNLFTGAAEAIAAILLFFRSTATLGALITIGVMSNVVLMNFSYDIYVKLISSTLLLMAVYLITPDLKQLYDFFFRSRPASLENNRHVIARKTVRLAIIGVEAVIIIAILFAKISGGLKLQTKYGDSKPKSALAGVYKIETFVINRDTIPPLATDSVRWNILVLDGMHLAELKLMNEKRIMLSFWFDEKENTLRLGDPDDTLRRDTFRFKRLDPSQIFLAGKQDNDSVYVTMNKMEFELEKHEIKFINDDHW